MVSSILSMALVNSRTAISAPSELVLACSCFLTWGEGGGGGGRKKDLAAREVHGLEKIEAECGTSCLAVTVKGHLLFLRKPRA